MEYVHFSFGWRIQRDDCQLWSIDAAGVLEDVSAIIDESLLQLEPLSDPRQLIEYVHDSLVGPVNSNRQECIAYSLIMAEDYGAAAAEMDKFVAMCEPHREEAPYVVEQIDRAKSLLAMLDSTPDTARQTLLDWSTHTKASLKLA